jgi:hypothetical protein
MSPHDNETLKTIRNRRSIRSFTNRSGKQMNRYGCCWKPRIRHLGP